MTEDGNFECEAERILLERGYEGTVFLVNSSYDSALVGVASDGRAAYDYELMVEYLVNEEGYEDEFEARDWIEYNTLRAIPYFGTGAPIVFYPKDYEGQSASEYLEDHCLQEEVNLIEGLDDCFIGITADDSPVYDFDLAEAREPGVTQRDFVLLETPPVFVKSFENVE